MTPEQAANHTNLHETIDWIESANVDELKRFLLVCEHEYRRTRAQMCLTVALSRQTHKAHWSLPWTFWVTVGVLIVSLAILIIAALSWQFPKTPPIPNDKPAPLATNFVSIPTNLPPVKAATQ
jgi:hypothetical protein